MSGKFQKKTSGFIVTALIGLIVISFMFSGYQSMKGTPDTVAQVGNFAIKLKEYRYEYDRQLHQYRQMFGQNLTSKQIEKFGLKKSAMQNLISRKLILKFGNKMGVSTSDEEVKKEIKNIHHFKTNEKFDFKKYKLLLSRNQLTPDRFEKDIATGQKQMITQTILSEFPLSKKYSDDIKQYKAKQYNTEMIQITKKSLKKFISVSKKEINKFMKDEDNLARAKSIFANRKITLSQPEQIKARHILLKSTPKNDLEVRKRIEKLAKKVSVRNFKRMANKHTEDPSNKNKQGKMKGGDLGFFSKGRMVPQFENIAFNLKPGTISKPVKTSFGYHLIYVEQKKAAIEATFDKFKNEIVKELMQKERQDEVKQLANDLSKEIKELISKNDSKKIAKLQKKYDFQYEKKKTINMFDGTVGGISLSTKQIQTIFNREIKRFDIFVFDEPATVTIIKASQYIETKDEKKKKKIEKNNRDLKWALSKKLSEDIIKSLRKTTKIKIFNIL